MHACANLTLNIGVAKSDLHDIYADPCMRKVKTDYSNPLPLKHPLATYLTARVNGVFAGVFLAIRFSEVEIEFHSLLNKKARLYSRKFFAMAIEWAFSHESVLRITAHIIQGLESTRNACLKIGFKQEGFRRSAYVRGGLPIGVYTLGLLRSEWGN